MLQHQTLREILEDPLIAQIAPHAISRWDLTKEDFYNWTIGEIAEKKGWRMLEKGLERLLEAASQGEYCFSLYSAEECRNAPSKEQVSMVWLPSADEAADDRPFILLAPGGAFVRVWNITEGWPIARIYNELGYHVFVLTYQVEVEGAAVHALDDMARALQMIRRRREQFHVDPDQYITCGFSAGGYLVCLWNTEIGYRAHRLPKPRACFPVYPVTSYRLMNMPEWENRDRFSLAAVGCTINEACAGCYEIPRNAEGFPPSAIFAAAQDELVDPEHSRALARALEKAGIPCRLEIGPHGGHGFADGTGMCMEGWPHRAIRWFEQLA